MSRFFLKAGNFLVNLVIICCLMVAGAYSVYALWDNSRVYAAAEDVQADMLRLKPVTDESGDSSGPSFADLLAVNPDVCAWVTMDNTKIDLPVLQGEDNLSYINTDVYGDFALAGSIFLDARNNPDFSDRYSLLYGHHMENGGMFGDLDLYKDEEFFNQNTSGTLLLPGGSYRLEVFAYLLIEAGDKAIFDPARWQSDASGLLTYAQENAVYLHQDTLAQLMGEESPQILAFSTCSSEFTDARTIILAAMEPIQAADQEVE